MTTTKRRVRAEDKSPIVKCAVCQKHVTKEMAIRCKDKAYCCVDCAEGYRAGKR